MGMILASVHLNARDVNFEIKNGSEYVVLDIRNGNGIEVIPIFVSERQLKELGQAIDAFFENKRLVEINQAKAILNKYQETEGSVNKNEHVCCHQEPV